MKFSIISLLLSTLTATWAYDSFISQATPHYKYSIFGGGPKGINYAIPGQLLQQAASLESAEAQGLYVKIFTYKLKLHTDGT